MTDRELLELAAKAAGMKPGTWFDGWNDPGREFGDYWNPLLMDGDALRLAVKLEIKVMPCQDDSCAKTGGNAWICVVNETDPYAATRRAIVRVAAAIGKEMP